MSDERLLTDEEIKIAKFAWQCFLDAHADTCDMDAALGYIIEEVAKSQLAKDEARHWKEIKEIFGEIEKHCLVEIKGSNEFVLEKCPWYPIFKSKYQGD